MNSEIENVKQKLSENSSLTSDELLVLLENFTDTILIKGRFDSTIKAFYNYNNFSKLSKLIALEDPSKFSHLFKKLDNIRVIEIKLFNKEAKMSMFLGVVLFFSGVFVCILLDFGINLLGIAGLFAGILIFLRGLGKYRQY